MNATHVVREVIGLAEQQLASWMPADKEVIIENSVLKMRVAKFPNLGTKDTVKDIRDRVNGLSIYLPLSTAVFTTEAHTLSYIMFKQSPYLGTYYFSK